MNLWVFLTIIIIAGYLIDAYNKNQKLKVRFRANDKYVNELEDEIKKLRLRIENLEIIAVSDPDNFQDRARNVRYAEKETDASEDNQRLVNELARKKQGVR
jgi:hypothetical protein